MFCFNYNINLKIIFSEKSTPKPQPQPNANEQLVKPFPNRVPINHLNKKRYNEQLAGIERTRHPRPDRMKGIRLASILTQHCGHGVKYAHLTPSIFLDMLVQETFGLNAAFNVNPVLYDYNAQTPLGEVDLKLFLNLDIIHELLAEGQTAKQISPEFRQEYTFSSMRTDGYSCDIVLKYGSPLSKFSTKEARESFIADKNLQSYRKIKYG